MTQAHSADKDCQAQLSAAMEKALGMDSPWQAADDFIESVGKGFLCDSILIYEKKDPGYAELLAWHSGELPSVDFRPYDSDLLTRLSGDHPVICRDLDARPDECAGCTALTDRGVHNLIAVRLVLSRTSQGLLLIINTSPMYFASLSQSCRQTAGFLSSLLSSSRLLRHLESVGLVDRLTGAGSRHGMYDLINAADTDAGIGILYGDVNDLKLVNDNQGHEAGDQLLKNVASLMMAVFGEQNVFRFGGDEFVCLGFGTAQPVWHEQIRRLREDFERRRLNIAMGEIWHDGLAGDFDSLLRRASQLMYDDKRAYYQKQNSDLDHSGYTPSYDQVFRIRLEDLTYQVLADQTGALAGTDLPGSYRDFIKLRVRNIHREEREAYTAFWNLSGIAMRIRRMKGLRSISTEYRLRQGEHYRWHEDVVVLLDSPDDPALLCLSRSIHLRKGRELAMLRDHGSLGNANIDLESYDVFMQHMGQWIAGARAEKFAVMAVDINFFKLFNEIYGRAAGNQMLERIGGLLRNQARKISGLAGYMGGDNFCMIFPMDGLSRADVERYIRHVISLHHVYPGFAPVFGVCECSTGEGVSALTLYDRALVALSMIKGRYTETIRFYDPSSFKMLRDTQLMLINAQRGFKKGEFTFYVQPKVNTLSGRIVSSEALVRWNHNGSVLQPAVFVEAMEQSGYIYALDRYIWEQVCIWQQDLLKRGLPALPCSVNVSRIDFYFCDVAEYFIGLVKKYELPAELIEIEITESAYSQDEDKIRQAVRQLHEHGFRILLDDFGNGYSSLSTLRSLDVDILKIDKKFLDNEDPLSSNYMLLDTVINVAHMLDMYVITEGVETAEQCRRLKEMNCHLVQGYYFYKPMMRSQFEDLIGNPDNVTRMDWTLHKQVGLLNYRQLFNEHMLSDSIINLILGPVAICEDTGEHVNLVQMNRAFTDLTGIIPGSADQDDWQRRIAYASDEGIRDYLRSSDSQPGLRDQTLFRCGDAAYHMLRWRAYPMAIRENRHFYLMTVRRQN